MKKIILLIIIIFLIPIIKPFEYIEPNYNIQLKPIGYSLDKGYIGLKVYEIKKKLNLPLEDITYDQETINAVKKFQQNNHLADTGIVDLRTWIALELNEEDWYNLEVFIYPCQVNEYSSYQERISALTTTAYRYLGTRYIVGASGKVGSGVDCSGLIMQIMYSAGLDPKPISPLRHVLKEYEYESYSLWKHENIKHYSYKDVLVGDLVFFKNKRGRVNHVGIYVGNNQVIEATTKRGVVLNTLTKERIKKIKCIGRLIEVEK